MKMKIIIGLTGGIASGKSTVTAMLKEKGAWVVDADQVARQVVDKGEPALEEIVNVFGSDVLQADGQLNRAALGTLVFSSEEKRHHLNQITHPKIRQKMLRMVEEFRNDASQQVLVLEVPLLFETGWDKLVDQVWLVEVDEEIQLKRLMERSKLSEEEAVMRIRSQMSLTEKKRRAHVLINNNGDRSMLKACVDRQWTLLETQLQA